MAEILLADLEAEDAVLGAMLINESAIDVAGDMLEAEDFYRPGNGTLFGALCDLRSADVDVDVVTLGAKLEAGGLKFDRDRLFELRDKCPTATSVKDYATIVASRGRMQRLRTAALQCAHEIEHAVDVDEAADVVERLMLAASERRSRSTGVNMGDALEAAAKELAERARGGVSHAHILSGIGLIDHVGGLERGGLHILGARTSTGKTSLALQIATNVALNGGRVLFASLEMNIGKITDRLIEQRCQVCREALLSGKLSEEEEARLRGLTALMKAATLVVDYHPRLTIEAIRSRARRMHARAPLDLVVVDYVGLVKVTQQRNETREQKVAETSAGLKTLAGELDCAVLALSQLNREFEHRPEGSEPKLSDLRESGSLEQDADMVIMAWPVSADVKAGKPTITTNIRIAKHRNGPTKLGAMDFVTTTTAFSEISV